MRRLAHLPLPRSGFVQQSVMTTPRGISGSEDRRRLPTSLEKGSSSSTDRKRWFRDQSGDLGRGGLQGPAYHVEVVGLEVADPLIAANHVCETAEDGRALVGG